jgi:pyridoxal phosphate enzyme (YggS family)
VWRDMSIAENLERVRAEVASACERAGRRTANVALMAVSKVHPVASLEEAYAAGQRLFGENRVQEWQAKAETAGQLAGLEMHLIGPLQSNKTTPAAQLFQAVDTLDSIKLATRLNEASARLGRVLSLLVEVKLSPEESKHGVQPEDLPALLDAVAALANVRVDGLMTVPPWPSDLARAGEEARPYFARLRALRDQAAQNHPAVTALSMGMSNDFAAAIAEGSTCVRIGTAIFGKRMG